MSSRRTTMLLVPLLVAAGVWGGFQLYRGLWILLTGSAPYERVQPLFLAASIVVGVAIGWGVLLTGPQRSPWRSTVRATALGVSTVLLPGCQLVFVLPPTAYFFGG
ncbi:hypothetical protein [Cryptosporangium minutisporangium]|uniref:Uncharacterized protein n=1 Tax=Cryptosporangium minutisporangium TaxID=113569 RepID=A0ABP6T8H2_9ACTN